jgi:hypothetical protein
MGDGGVTERPNVPVLKTGVGLPTVGSNPTPSAIWPYGPATLRNQFLNLADPLVRPLARPGDVTALTLCALTRHGVGA